MSYVTKVLQPGETILATARLHWFVYLPALSYTVLAVGCAAASRFATRDQQAGMVLLIAAALFAVVAVISWAGAALRRVTTELAVTDHRVIYKAGLISRHTVEMNRSKVESVDVEQSIPGRLFGYGTVILRGTGGSLEPIRNIGDPLRFRTAITAA